MTPKQLTDDQTATVIRSLRNLIQGIKDLSQLKREIGFDPSEQELLDLIPEDRKDVAKELFREMASLED